MNTGLRTRLFELEKKLFPQREDIEIRMRSYRFEETVDGMRRVAVRGEQEQTIWEETDPVTGQVTSCVRES